MISSKFAGAAVIAAGTLTIPSGAVYAHVPGHGPGHNLLMPYEDFIMYMRRADGGSCCHKQDGIGSIPEKPRPDGSYVVTIPMGTVPGQQNTVIVDVSTDKVLTAEHARAVCAEYKSSTTCVIPPFNIIWLAPSTINSKVPTVYCYWPTPQFSENKSNQKGLGEIQKAAAEVETRVMVLPASFVTPFSVRFETAPPADQSAPMPVHQHH